MRTLAIVQSKGGAGKTTIALNLMAAGAQAGRRVVLIDADHHAAGSTVLVGFTPPDRSLYTVLRNNVHPREVAHHLSSLNVLVLPGSYALSNLASDLPLNALAECVDALANGSSESADSTMQPDLVIIDCPGGDVMMARLAVYAADRVLIPLNFSALDMTANESTIHLIESVREARVDGPALAGLVPNRVQRGDTVARDLAFLVASRLPLLPTIPDSNLIRRTGSHAELERRLVVCGHPKSQAAERFRLLHSVLSGARPWSQDDGLRDLAEQVKSSVDWLVSSPGASERAE